MYYPTDLLQTLHENLLRLRTTVAVAESCTGGLLGGALTSHAGSSAYFLGGVLAYDDSVKRDLLGVQAETIVRYGAVSAESARQMANGVLKLLGADVAIAVTGVAGPEGGTAEKPVGTTFICLYSDSFMRVEEYHWQGDRDQNRSLSVEAALRMLNEFVERRLGATSRAPLNTRRSD